MYLLFDIFLFVLQEITASHPGPIDNKCLIGPFGDELSRSIIENVDFVLLPDSAFNLLNKDYGGGKYIRYNYTLILSLFIQD